MDNSIVKLISSNEIMKYIIPLANNVFFISSASFYRIEDFELTPYQFLAKTYVSSAHASVQIEMANPLDLTRRDRERRRKWQVRN